MLTVEISELQASLSEYVTRIRAGEEFLLTDRGVPIAKLVPLSPEANGEAVMAGLIQAGLVKWPEQPLPDDFLESEPEIEDPEGAVLKALLEERESGW